ncbi:MAG: GHMP kinase [Flavobacterium sp.]|nr:GHMP kinase [Flavobacterium sp.]
MFNKKTFYSNGKLLITAEYLVLDGAKALALPTKFGQSLIVESGNNNEIVWKSYDLDNSIWYEDIIAFNEIKNRIFVESQDIKNTLIAILHQSFLKNPNFINNSVGYKVATNLTFSKNWGLGTSSTLINNIAQWLEIDAFELLNNSFGGSGYDIACAQNNLPILYHLENKKPIFEKVNFNPNFKNNLYFLYLNQKQNSRKAIENYRKKEISKHSIQEINTLTNQVLLATNIHAFSSALKKHENLLSHILEVETIQQQLFSDFVGTIKSLGAWGGDFVMVLSETDPVAYFKNKGFETILKYSEMIL